MESLRDNYVRKAKKSKIVESGSETSKNSTYIHYERLKFLQKSIEKNITERSFCTNDENPKRTPDTNDENKTFKTPNEMQRTSKTIIKTKSSGQTFCSYTKKKFSSEASSRKTK